MIEVVFVFTFLLILLLVLSQVSQISEAYYGYGHPNFNASFLRDDISIGNPLSWSNYRNPRHYTQYMTYPFDLTRYPKATGLQVITQGHGVPLSYEEKAAPPVDNSMFYFNRHMVSPDCCPSTHSTSRGCVCWRPKGWY